MRLIDALYAPARAVLFRMDAERAHERTLGTLSLAPRAWGAVARALCGRTDPRLARTVAGLRLSGPVGLAAGLDKDGVAIPFWPRLGFGFIEVGTVTAHPQPGNPKPRLFRLPEERALVNRMGFNNHGSAALAERLRELHERGHWPRVPVGVNLGKSKITELADAPADYACSAQRLRGLADYFTVNVSSPNTPGLRSLQDADALTALLPVVVEAAGATPVFLKLAPDLAVDAIGSAVDLAVEHGIAGVISSNTTIRRDTLRRDPEQAGGLSGAPLRDIAGVCIRATLRAASGRLPVIGVGGISTAAHASELLDLGCAAVQLYTALIYEGPALPARLHRSLARTGGAAAPNTRARAHAT